MVVKPVNLEKPPTPLKKKAGVWKEGNRSRGARVKRSKGKYRPQNNTELTEPLKTNSVFQCNQWRILKAEVRKGFCLFFFIFEKTIKRNMFVLDFDL